MSCNNESLSLVFLKKEKIRSNEINQNKLKKGFKSTVFVVVYNFGLET